MSLQGDRKRDSRGDADEDGLLNTILPSYEMFQSTVSKNLTPTEERYEIDPPTYEIEPVSSTATSGLRSVEDMDSTETPYSARVQNENDDSSVDIWENTILANVHKLKNLTLENNPLSKKLKVEMDVTEKVCQKGVEPITIDPSQFEYKQGDFIHGFVKITNTSPDPISFEMVYVVFEGTTIVTDSRFGLVDVQRPVKVCKFLNMLDLFASWSYANIDRLKTDQGNPHDWCEGETDPYDNTTLSIGPTRDLQPNVTYKRYFSFKIPHKLLDDTCEEHNLATHVELPPSLGLQRSKDPPSVLFSKREQRTRDFSFVDTTVSYSVNARIIGRASTFNFPSTKGDQYVISQEDFCPIRVIPKSNLESIHDLTTIERERKMYYQAFVTTIQRKIQMGQTMLNVGSEKRTENALSPQLTPITSTDSSMKLRQLYEVAGSSSRKKSSLNEKDSDLMCQYLMSFKKKTLTGKTRTLGVISLSTPKHAYRASYVPPLKFRKQKAYDTEFSIPIELSYYQQKDKASKEMPEIKAVSVELVALTLRSKKHYIPVEITHDMCYRDHRVYSKKEEPDNFDTIMVNQFKSYFKELSSLMNTLGFDVMQMETQLYSDVKSLALLSTKYINLIMSDTKIISKSENHHGHVQSVNDISWVKEETLDENYNLFAKKFDLSVDLEKLFLKTHNEFEIGHDQFCLVPSFQSCLVSRIYYWKVTLKLTNNLSMVVHAPVYIENT